MTTIVITGLELTKSGFSKMRRDFNRTSVLSNRMGRALRDDARRRITTQGGGSWAPLSKWTKARTGRKKAFVTERNNIKFKLVGGQLLVGHDSDGPWSLQDHEKGFTTAPEVPATINLKNPKALGIKSQAGPLQKNDFGTGQITITRAKESVVPARRVFANEVQADNIIKPIVIKWVNDIVKRSRAKK